MMIDSNRNDEIQNSNDFYQDDFDRPASNQSRPDTTASAIRAKSGLKKQRPIDKNKADKNVQNQKGPFKLLIQFLISYVGLIAVVALYVAGGAYLFQILEQHNTVQNCQVGEGEWDNLRVSYRTTLFNYIFFNTTSDPWLPVDNSTVIASLNTPRDGPWIYNPKITAMLNEFATQVRNISSSYGYTGQDCENDNLWEYFSALLFTVSIVTTIGYGHVTPKTWEGQIVCVCYATLGIPLYLISLAKVSFLVADMFRYLYRRVFCTICINAWEAHRRTVLTNKDVIANPENDPNIITTNNNRLTSVNTVSGSTTQLTTTTTSTANKPIVVVNDDLDNLDEEQDSSKVKVPLVIVIGCLVAYIVFGAYIFTLLESYSFVQGIYYCYVSLATIGFGDLVPGVGEISDGQTSLGARNLIIAIIYIFFGMANLVMCYDLMEEQLSEKFRMIGTRLGFIKEEEEEESNNKTDKPSARATEPPTPTGNKPNSEDEEEYAGQKQHVPSDLYHSEDTNIDIQYNSSREPTRIHVKSRDNTTMSDRKQDSKSKVQSREPTAFFPSPLS